VGLLTAASCNNDIEPAGGDTAPVAARVTALIGAAQSRASGTAWDANDRIGISGAEYDNVPYITDGNGDFSPVGSEIFFQSSEVVTFNAYYPYNAAGGKLSVNTASQQEQEKFDFLYAKGATASAAQPKLSFTGDNAFRHCMTRLVLDIKADANTGFSFSDIQNGKYTLSGITHSGVFDTTTGKATVTSNQATDNWEITATADDNNVHSYSMILFPQEGANLTFKADIGVQTYEAILTPVLEAGYVYRYNITVKNTGLSVSVCTIHDWDEGKNYSEEAEVVIPFGDKPMELADVGDYYFSDGTFADKNTDLTPRQAKACVGIVFHKGPRDNDNSNYSDSGIGQAECHGYVVALTDVGQMRWNNDYGTTGVSTSETDWNGYDNQKILVERGIDNYPAAKGCKYYGTGSGSRFAAPTGSSGWFLPSAGQLKHLYDHKSDISGLMERCRDQSGDGNIGWFRTDWSYWSSSERSGSHAWCVFFDNGDTSPYGKYSAFGVRAVLAF